MNRTMVAVALVLPLLFLCNAVMAQKVTSNNLGKPDDPATQEFYKFLDPLVGPTQ